jgi:hypothetical protein
LAENCFGGSATAFPPLKFVRLKTLATAAFFWLLYFLLLKKE